MKKYFLIIVNTYASYKKKLIGYPFLRFFNLFSKLSIKFLAKINNHPLPSPWLGLKNGQNTRTTGKGRATHKRLQNIVDNLPKETKSIADIGSNNSFFSISLAEMGYYVSSFEPDNEFIRVAFESLLSSKVENMSLSRMPITPDTVQYLPNSDVYLVMSVAQRWIHLFEKEGMFLILKEILSKTNKLMIFELPNVVDSKKEKKYLSFLGESLEDFDRNVEKMFMEFGAKKVIKLGQLPTDFNDDKFRDVFLVYS